MAELLALTFTTLTCIVHAARTATSNTEHVSRDPVTMVTSGLYLYHMPCMLHQICLLALNL